MERVSNLHHLLYNLYKDKPAESGVRNLRTMIELQKEASLDEGGPFRLSYVDLYPPNAEDISEKSQD